MPVLAERFKTTESSSDDASGTYQVRSEDSTASAPGAMSMWVTEEHDLYSESLSGAAKSASERDYTTRVVFGWNGQDSYHLTKQTETEDREGRSRRVCTRPRMSSEGSGRHRQIVAIGFRNAPVESVEREWFGGVSSGSSPGAMCCRCGGAGVRMRRPPTRGQGRTRRVRTTITRRRRRADRVVGGEGQVVGHGQTEERRVDRFLDSGHVEDDFVKTTETSAKREAEGDGTFAFASESRTDLSPTASKFTSDSTRLIAVSGTAKSGRTVQADIFEGPARTAATGRWNEFKSGSHRSTTERSSMARTQPLTS